MACPVLANGDISSAGQAQAVLRMTGAAGLMIGRGAIRNPWLFEQIRQALRSKRPFVPRGADVLTYVHALYDALRPPIIRERAYVQKLKKYLNYLGVGVEPTGQFLHQMRRATTKAELFRVCEEFLGHDRPLALEPFPLGASQANRFAETPSPRVSC
jgi:tRNA-dihydrouridine synthase